MAEAAPASVPKKIDPKALASSLFAGNKAIPATSFWAYLFSALVIDLLLGEWLPGAGTAFIAFCRGMYWLNGYKTDKMLFTTVLNALIGLIPILEMLATVAFVVTTYIINVAETKAGTSVTRAVGRGIAERIAADQIGKGLRGFGGAKVAANDNTPAAHSTPPPNKKNPEPKNVDGVSKPSLAGGLATDARNYLRQPAKNTPQAANDNAEENYREAA